MKSRHEVRAHNSELNHLNNIRAPAVPQCSLYSPASSDAEAGASISVYITGSPSGSSALNTLSNRSPICTVARCGVTVKYGSCEVGAPRGIEQSGSMIHRWTSGHAVRSARTVVNPAMTLAARCGYLVHHLARGARVASNARALGHPVVAQRTPAVRALAMLRAYRSTLNSERLLQETLPRSTSRTLEQLEEKKSSMPGHAIVLQPSCGCHSPGAQATHSCPGSQWYANTRICGASAWLYQRSAGAAPLALGLLSSRVRLLSSWLADQVLYAMVGMRIRVGSCDVTQLLGGKSPITLLTRMVATAPAACEPASKARMSSSS